MVFAKAIGPSRVFLVHGFGHILGTLSAQNQFSMVFLKLCSHFEK
ncbi:hypothetical protein LEP1GSC202_1810 [Leptospira yanagawae serovar Saopaulo str. Sao Paulo = ATCC 700523]|uniref:Uncharacterized protein n=1 Tax=Leptospira yanagawae serovar Saopaulo str. Sao Paulo = ATCC 700523 TaxID=1249483 RepID=A0A5E8HDX2_9LEPT|nr:hypothetical protein LEP1GSC202_1810 [Leptospira yanagawae serovar Saopaulo str. Sao Paulo = ATCC 700523]